METDQLASVMVLDELTRVALIALVGLISALFTQIFLRWDQARRDTQLRLLNSLRLEHTLYERLAHKARQLVLQGETNSGGKQKSKAEIDHFLFEDVYKESNLETLCAELDALGMVVEDYRRNSHLFRDTCNGIALRAVDGYAPISAQKSISEIIKAVMKLSEENGKVVERIYRRFSWF